MIVACLLLVVAVTLPPEAHPWSRAVCQGLGALGAFVVIVRTRFSRKLLPWIAAGLPFVVVSILASACRSRAVDEAADAVLLILAGTLGWRLAGSATARRVLSVTLIALGTSAALHGMLQHHLTYPTWAATLRASGDVEVPGVLGVLERGRPSGPFILPAALGGFLGLCLPLAVSSALRSGTGRVARIAALAAVALQAYALALTRSIGALIALAAACVIFLPVLRPRARAAAATGVVLLAVLGSGAFALSRRTEIMARQGLDPLTLRLGNWGAALRMIEDHPLFGTGPGSFATSYPRYMRPGMNETRYAHDSYLQAAAGWGLWIAVPIGALLVAFVRAARRPPGDRAERFGFLAAAGTFVVHNAGDFTLYLPGIAVPAAMVIGIVLGPGPEGHDPHRSTPGEPACRRPAVRAAILAVSAGLGGLYAAHAILLARSRSFLLRAGEAAAAGDRIRALDLARRAGCGRPGDPDPSAFLAQMILAEDLDDPRLRAEGERAAERALKADPAQAVLHFTRARYYVAAGDAAAAWRERFVAHELYPLKKEYWVPPPAGVGTRGGDAKAGDP
jgi:O-antigen ligase